MKKLLFSFPISSSRGETTWVPIFQQQQFAWPFRYQKQAKRIVCFHYTYISDTQFVWRSCQMLTEKASMKEDILHALCPPLLCIYYQKEGGSFLILVRWIHNHRSILDQLSVLMFFLFYFSK